MAFCSTSSTVTPLLAITLICLKIALTRIGAMPSDGSSSSSISGLLISDAADREHLLFTTGKGSGQLLAALFQTREELIDPVEEFSCQAYFREKAPSIRFSSTVRMPNTRRPSGEWLIPSLTILCAGSWVSS